MKKHISVLLIFITIFCNLHAQQPDTLINKLDSLSKVPGTETLNNTAPSAYNQATKITVPSYFILLGSNTKQAFLKPFHMKGNDWKRLGIGAGAIATLTFADRPVQRFALRFRNQNPGLLKLSKTVTNFGGPYEYYTLGALGAYGFIFGNGKIKTTTLLASQAYLLGGTVETFLKFLSGRTRPSFYSPNTVARPTFKGPFAKSVDYTGAKVNSAFPSGHTTVAFAAATVFALEYKSKPLVPVICYTSATLIGISRITENKHWLTDVLTGGMLGLLIGRQVVNNYHRYAMLKAPKKVNGSMSLNMQTIDGTVVRGLTYTLRW